MSYSMHILSITFNILVLSTLRTMLVTRSAIIGECQQWVYYLNPFSTLYCLLFQDKTASHFQDMSCPYLKLTSIHIFSKGLNYFCISELCEPKGSKTILIPQNNYLLGGSIGCHHVKPLQLAGLRHFCSLSNS